MKEILIRLRRPLAVVVIGMVLLVATGVFQSAPAYADSAVSVQEGQHPLAKRAIVRGGGANLRAQPGGAIQQKLPLATALMAVGQTADGQWIKVELADGTSGWIHVDELVAFGLSQLPVLDAEIVESAETTPADTTVEEENTETSTTAEKTPVNASGQTATVTTSARRLNVRSGPGTNYGIILSLPPGATAAALARNADASWIQIRLPNSSDGIGWTSARYLELSGESNDLPVSHEVSQAPAVKAVQKVNSNPGLKGKLVFQDKSGGTIYVHDFASGKTRSLTSGMDPAISPDGKQVAFMRDNGADAGLYLIGIDGSNERRIYSESKLRAPSWSPDGEYVVFSRVTGQGKCRDVGHGICIPDRSMICYPGYPCITDYPLNVYDLRGLSRVDQQGGQFKDVPTARDAKSPDWSEGGIVYQSWDGIEVTDAYEGAQTRTVAQESRYQDPSWQPGGRRIVFHSLEKDHREIFVMNPDGSGLQALTRPPSALIKEPIQNVAPVYSPDGKSILFLSNRSGEWAFWVMNADGSNLRRLAIDVPIEYRYQAEQVASWGR